MCLVPNVQIIQQKLFMNMSESESDTDNTVIYYVSCSLVNRPRSVWNWSKDSRSDPHSSLHTFSNPPVSMTMSWGASELCVVDKNTRTFNSLVVKDREPGIRPTPLLRTHNYQNKTTWWFWVSVVQSLCGGFESLWWFWVSVDQSLWWFWDSVCFADSGPAFPVSADAHWYSSAHIRLNTAAHCTKYAAPLRPPDPVLQHHIVAPWFRMKLLMQIQLKHGETMIRVFLFAPSGVFQLCGVHCPAGPPWPLRRHMREDEGSAASCHFNVLLRWYFLSESRRDAALCLPELKRLLSETLQRSINHLYRFSSTSAPTQTLFGPGLQ